MTTRDGMIERFGEEQTEEYIRLARATRGLIAMWETFLGTPDGSFLDIVLGDKWNEVITKLEERPAHAAAMVESLAALIVHMKNGGKYDSWFSDLGIDTTESPTV